MLHRVIGRERERKRDLALNTRDFKESSNIPPLWSCPHLHHVTDLTYVCWPLCFLLKCFPDCQRSGNSFRHIQIQRNRQADRHNPGLPPLPVINSVQKVTWLAGRLICLCHVGVILYITQHPYDTMPHSKSVNDSPLSL